MPAACRRDLLRRWQDADGRLFLFLGERLVVPRPQPKAVRRSPQRISLGGCKVAKKKAAKKATKKAPRKKTAKRAAKKTAKRKSVSRK